mgnify:CR=1 FL=1
MKTWWLLGVLSAGCAAPQPKEDAPVSVVAASRDALAGDGVKAALAALPVCEAGVRTAPLTIETTFCTRKYCETPCCNGCGWRATQPDEAGELVALDPERVRAVLKLGESSLDCEVKAWAAAVSGQPISLGEPACVAR